MENIGFEIGRKECLHVKKAIKNTFALKIILSKIPIENNHAGRRCINWREKEFSPILQSSEFQSALNIIKAYFPSANDNVWFTFVNLMEGTESVAYHSDEEHESIFVSISIGASRTLYLRDTKTKVIKASYILEDGDLFFLHPEIDKTHEHGIEPEPEMGIRYSVLVPFDVK